MTWLSGLVTYFLIWWVVIFAVLPWGNRAPELNEIEPGNAGSAPKNPNIGKKFLATTLISGVIWLIIYILVEMNVIDFRGFARQIEQGETSL